MPFGWAQGRLRLRFTAQSLRLRSGRQCRDRRLLIWRRFRGTSLCQFGRRHHGSAGVSPASIRPVPNPLWARCRGASGASQISLWREPVERKLPTEPPTNLGHHPTNQHIPQSPPIPKITVQTTPFAPLRVLRGQSPSFQPPTRHSGGGRNPEGRGRGESH